MVKKIYNCVISSENENKTIELVYDYKVDFPQGHISADENETISLNAVSFNTMHLMYNITCNVTSINGHNQFSILKRRQWRILSNIKNLRNSKRKL